jgi:PTH2 family peptidyl-tRNA hydrolase
MNTKQVIVLRKDLNMRKGKMCAQAAHASMKVFFDRLRAEAIGTTSLVNYSWWTRSEAEKTWVEGLFTKIVVGVDSEGELLSVYENAMTKGLLCSLVQDSGTTEFGGVPTYTAVAVGPDLAEKVDEVTGGLKLL